MPILTHLMITLQPNAALDFTFDPSYNHSSEFHTLNPKRQFNFRKTLPIMLHNRVLPFWFILYTAYILQI